MRVTTLLLSSLLVGGCVVHTDSPTYGPGPGPGAPPPDGATPLGALAMPGYRVAAGASAAVPPGDLGFVVTANGAGGYRIAWTDTTGSAVEFEGTATTDVGFDSSQLYPFGGATVTQSATNRVDFRSVPGASIDGVDLVSSSDPIYLDLQVNGVRSGFGVFFASASAGEVQAAYDPVAFTSP